MRSGVVTEFDDRHEDAVGFEEREGRGKGNELHPFYGLSRWMLVRII